MALDKTFSVGEVLAASDVNAYCRSMWAVIGKNVVASGSPVSSISYTGISSEFRTFRITFNLNMTTMGPRIRFNNDSSTNYTRQRMNADGINVLAGRDTGQSGIDLAISGTNGPVVGEIIIGKLSASVQARTTATVTGGSHSALVVATIAGSWINTSNLIDRIDVIDIGSSMYGVVSLEGVRGA